MSFIKNKEEAIKKLRFFCSLEKVFFVHSNMWFESLKTRYPLEYIFFTQFSRRYTNSRNGAKNRFSNSIYLKIQKLLEYPLNQIDVDYLNSIISELDKQIINKQ
jgi:hypothetical protein